MKLSEIKEKIENGELGIFRELYSDLEEAKKRFLAAVKAFASYYGEEGEVEVFSVPGRSEISGNHTDHNGGVVLAGAVSRDIIAIARKTEDGEVTIRSDKYPEDKVSLSDIENKDSFKSFSSSALIAGVLKGFSDRGYNIGGFVAYTTSDVLSGSGISSSAAYEVMIGNILNHLYNNGEISAVNLAKIARFAECEYFGKPCGLMDQTACAVGGFVYMDFENPEEPIVEPIEFNLSEYGYELCIINTGGSHANLNEDYASVPGEMKNIARLLGREALRGLTENDIIKNIGNLRRVAGDRAVLRALHFMRENERVGKIKSALSNKDIEGFLDGIRASGNSSFKYLQNVYSNVDVKEQRISLALALADGYLENKDAAMRVHGGGFAGTIQVFVKKEDTVGFKAYMDKVFGDGAVSVLTVRKNGAIKLV